MTNWPEDEPITYLGLNSVNYEASGQTSIKEDTFPPRAPWLLTLNGVVYDTIARMSNRIFTEEQDWEQSVREWKSQILDIVEYSTAEDTADVFWRTLLRDRSLRDRKRLIVEDIEVHRWLFRAWCEGLENKNEASGAEQLPTTASSGLTTSDPYGGLMEFVAQILLLRD